MRSLAIVVLVVGCSDVQGSDVDGDGIPDDKDDCQASFEDEDEDVDFDGKDASVDLCPHDNNAAAGDLDVDGIPDACDLYIDPARPDTRRCVTSFAVRWMNASYLRARVGEQPWNLTWPLTATATDNVSVVSDLELVHPSTTFDVLATAKFANADDRSSFKLWLRAGAEPSSRDVACGVDGAGNLFVWAGNTRQAAVPLPAKLSGRFRLQATVGGLNATVLCRATVEDLSIATTRQVMLPTDGGYGFAATSTDITIHSLVIDSSKGAIPFVH
ncbi:MAG: hypothetical protein M4D80_31920 [Myxococcota bacterium]|nr:hypothetical protein [Deltaproteobacteria bacterium]MDQ3339793.1 hypothetical protein [Myxococcota bacterium]